MFVPSTTMGSGPVWPPNRANAQRDPARPDLRPGAAPLPRDTRLQTPHFPVLLRFATSISNSPNRSSWRRISWLSVIASRLAE